MANIIRAKPPRKLTPQQDRFAQEYIIDLNASKAALRAGYSEASHGTLGYQLLQNPIIIDAIERHKKALAAKTQVTAEMVIAEYMKLGFTEMDEFATWDDEGTRLTPSANLTKKQTAAIQEITVKSDGERKIKLHDKKGALDSLGKHLGLFTERAADPEAPTPIAVNIVVEDGRRPDNKPEGEPAPG